jgi:thiol-disulfide isomerase/thioredoxin
VARDIRHVLLVIAVAVGGCLSDPAPVRLDAGTGGCGETDLRCDLEVYPCAPYGTGTCDTLDDLSFLTANEHAEALAGGDGTLSLGDLYTDKSIVGVLLFGTAGWCPACRIEAHDLNGIYADFQHLDTEGHRLEFVTVVFQDNSFSPATREFAAAYDAGYGFDFPTVADPAGEILALFNAQSAPGNILIDATVMQIRQVIEGYDETQLVNALRDLDGPAVCR